MRPFLPALAVFLALLSSVALADCGDPVALKRTTTENHEAGILVSGDTAILRPFPDKWNALLLRQVVGEEIEVCVTVIARIDEKPLASAGGLQFWRSGQSVADDFYAIKIDAGGNAAIVRYEDETWRDIVKWGRSKLLKKGLNARNELRLTTSGAIAKLYINGKLFKTVERQPGGKIGYGTAVMAEAGKGTAQFDFTNVRSSTQNDTPATPSTDANPVSPSDGPQKTADATKDVVLPLDAEGKRIYDLLLAVPPHPDNVAFAKTRFIKAIGNPSPAANSGHGSAEVTYVLDPPAGGTVNRISYFLYPDEEAAKAYMPKSANPFSMLRDHPEGSISGRTAEPDGPFAEPIPYAFGYQTLERTAWTRWLYREGRVVMVAFTNETLPPLKEDGVTTDKISEDTFDQGYILLQIAKFQLDAIKDMKITTETRPATGVTASLNAEMQAVYDRLLAAPPDANNLARLDTALVDVKGNLTPPAKHGTAEIVFTLKPPADDVETSLSFYFFPDAAASGQYLSLEDFDSSIYSDLGTSKIGQGKIDPFTPFKEKLDYLVGEVEGQNRGWIRFPYQDGNVVIVAQTGEKKTSDAPYKVSAEAMRQGALLLALGKLELDAARAASAAPSGDASSGAPPASDKATLPSGPSATPKDQ